MSILMFWATGPKSLAPAASNPVPPERVVLARGATIFLPG